MGYVPRYREYKSRPDEIHSVFQSNGIYKAWTTSRSSQYLAGPPSTFLKVDPHVTGTIFSSVYDGTKNTDPYQCYFAFDCQMSRNMSEYGLPTF